MLTGVFQSATANYWQLNDQFIMQLNLYLIRLSLKYVWRQKWQSGLLVLGILLGVAVVIAIDYANETSKRALELSSQSITGSSTHQILSSGEGIDENFFVTLMRSGLISKATPVLEGYVNLLDLNNQPMQVLGIDPFLDVPFRSYYNLQDSNQINLLGTLSAPNRIILSKKFANKNNINIGDRLEISFQGKKSYVEIAGLIESDDPLNDSTLQGLLITDISTAQELLNKIGILDRIEIIEDDAAKIAALEKIIPAGLSLRITSEQNAQVTNLTSAFQLNLTALSLLALVVGIFLIFNTMTFSVIQRRELIGVLRSLGFYRREIFFMIIFEAAIIAVIGTTLGILTGIFLGKQTVGLILQTINDLYYVITVKSVSLPIISIVKGAILGLFATIIAAIPPAYAATRVTPRISSLRSNLEVDYENYNQKIIFCCDCFFCCRSNIIVALFFKSLACVRGNFHYCFGIFSISSSCIK